jgi:uncharacterized protein (DUF4415 family)
MPKLTDEELMDNIDWSKARRVSPEKHARLKEAVENTRRLRGRPRMAAEEKAQPVTIRVSPVVLARAKREAKRKHVGYQTILNEVLRRWATAS